MSIAPGRCLQDDGVGFGNDVFLHRYSASGIAAAHQKGKALAIAHACATLVR
jgi:hypothetical protein